MSERIAAELPRMQPYDSPVPGDGEIPLRRPIGVTMIALFSLGIAVLVTIRFVGLVRDDKEGLVWVLGWIPLLLIVIALISGIGLWRRSAWAWPSHRFRLLCKNLRPSWGCSFLSASMRRAYCRRLRGSAF